MSESAWSREDAQALRRIIAEGSHSFYAASRLLPARVRGPAFALYGFCRACDDEIDETDGDIARIARLRLRLKAAYAGQPADSPVDRAFAGTVARFDIPQTLPAALIEGLEWDAQGRRYASLEELLDYAARVAGAVGAMMALVMGARSPQALARASDLGSAMQLTNIARDIGSDARNGRIYLPLDWLRAGGVDPEALLARPVASAPVRDATARLLAEAGRLYARGLSGVDLLPLDCRPAIRAAGLIYAEIGAKVREAGCDSVSGRAVVSGRRKLALVAQAVSASLLPGAPSATAPALAANRFLVTAAARDARPPDLSELNAPARMLEVCLRLRARSVQA